MEPDGLEALMEAKRERRRPGDVLQRLVVRRGAVGTEQGLLFKEDGALRCVLVQGRIFA